jgi:hypothetical protein
MFLLQLNKNAIYYFFKTGEAENIKISYINS